MRQGWPVRPPADDKSAPRAKHIRKHREPADKNVCATAAKHIPPRRVRGHSEKKRATGHTTSRPLATEPRSNYAVNGRFGDSPNSAGTAAFSRTFGGHSASAANCISR